MLQGAFQARAAEAQIAAKQARYRALHDEPSRLPNAEYFRARLERALCRREPPYQDLAVFYISLNLEEFQPAIDACAREAVDKSRRSVAAGLAAASRAEDMLGCLGGDTFACLAPGVSQREHLSALAKKLLTYIPFPLRIGVNPGDAASLPQANVRLLDRLEFHPKLALDLEAFKDRVEPTPQPLRHLVIGRRTLGRKAKLEPATRRGAIVPLLREAVIGLGIYQGMEFVLQRGMRDVVGKVGTLATRSACATSALSHAQVWHLELGRDPDDNWAQLLLMCAAFGVAGATLSGIVTEWWIFGLLLVHGFAGAIGGPLGAFGAAQLVLGAMKRGGTKGGIAFLIAAAGIVVALLALVPVLGYAEAVVVPALAARLRRRYPERFAGLRTLAK